MEREFLEEIMRRLKNNNVLLVAPTGWGKTHLMMRLAVELAREGKVGLLAPTLTLLMKKWPELQQILSSTPSPPRAILTAGAGQYCAFGYQVPQRFCSRCPLHRRHHALQLEDRAVTFEEIDAITPEDVCGYWVQEALLSRYDIIAGHYGRLAKLVGIINYAFIDEAHEYYLPHITSYAISDIAELLGVPAEELDSIPIIRELLAEKLNRLDLDAQTEDRLYSLSSALRKTCWIEAQELHCMDLYDMPRGVRIFAATATPPPGWPPEGWGEKIEIESTIRPRAFVEPEARFYFKERYEGAALQLHFIAQWLQNFGIQSIAVFAISSLRHVLAYSLPPGVELYPAGG
jgi:hypothetical protein